jgi:hypothetical protein
MCCSQYACPGLPRIRSLAEVKESERRGRVEAVDLEA